MQFETEYQQQCSGNGIKPNQVILSAFRQQQRDLLELERVEHNDERVAGIRLVLRGDSLALFKHRLVDDDVIMLCRAIESSGLLSELVELDLRNNSIGNKGVEAIAQLISKSTCAINTLNLANNDLTTESARYIADALSGTVDEPVDFGLKHLSLNGNSIGNEGGMQLAQMLKKNTFLSSLDIGNTDQEAESLIAIATVLRFNDTITSLNIDNPRLGSLGEETTIHYAEMLKSNCTIKSLGMAKHGIRDDGARILIDSLVRNSHLEALDLRCNRIGVGGSHAIALHLANFNTLKYLNLHANRIISGGAQAIGESLAFNNGLLSLNIANNSIGDIGLVSIAEGITRNRTLRECYVWGNDFGDLSSPMFLDIVNSPTIKRLHLDVSPYVAEYDRDTSIVQIAKVS